MPLYGLEKVVLTSSSPPDTREIREAYEFHDIVEQSMAYGAFHGGDDASYIPGVGAGSLLDVLYEDFREQKDHLRSHRCLGQICGVRYYDTDVCLSIHGPDRREIRVMNVSLHDGCEESVFTVTRHHTAVEEMYCNYKSGDCQMELVKEFPLIAARCASSVDYFKLHMSSDDSSEPVKLNRIHGASTTGTVNGGKILDFSWNQYVSSHGIALEDSGMLFGTDLSGVDESYYSRSSRRSERIVDFKKGKLSELSSMGVTRCEACALHPQLSLVAWQDALLRVDFREKSSSLPVTSSQNPTRVLFDFSESAKKGYATCLMAFAAASRGASAPHAYAASTPSHVYLFDLRKPSSPLVTWEHYEKFPSTKTTSWFNLKASVPEGLQFVSLGGKEDALLATNSFKGSAFLLQWRCTDEGEYIEFCDGKISYKKDLDKSPRNFLDDDHQKDRPLHFAWKPIAFKRFEPVEPPTIVYNHMYPAPGMPEISKWQKHMGFITQDRIKCLSKDLTHLPPKISTRCSDLGSCFMQRKWENSSVASDSLLVRLGLYDEIIIGSFNSSVNKDSTTGDTSEIPDEVVFSRACQAGQCQKACSGPNQMTEATTTGSGTQEINFESSGYTLGFDNRIQAPIHGLLLHQSQVEYNMSQDQYTENIDGFTPAEIGVFLRELLGQLCGIPLSAFEAWHILQRCLIESSSTQGEGIQRLIECLSDHTSLFLRPVELEPKDNKRKQRDCGRACSNDLEEFLSLKGFFSHSEHLDGIINSQKGDFCTSFSDSEWVPTSSLLPSRLFLQIWDTLDSHPGERFLSWTLKSPGDLADILYSFGPLHSIENLIVAAKNSSRKEATDVLINSIVSMKVLVESSDSQFPLHSIHLEDRKEDSISSEALNRLEKLQERWNMNET